MAIMIKENGQSEFLIKSPVMIYLERHSGGAGLVDLPQSGRSSKAKIYRIRGIRDALDQSDPGKYLRQAEQMDKQRQQKAQEELGTRMADAYAAWENGLDAPDAPSAGEVMAAFGWMLAPWMPDSICRRQNVMQG